MASKMSKRFTGFLARSKSVNPSAQASSSTNGDIDVETTPADSPERKVGRGVWLFCESGSSNNGGEEVLHLPVIVDAAESSPKAAAVAAQQIRRFLGREWAVKPHVQYNAIMLMRILSDNPGPSFTRNFDKSFVGTVKEVLRMCKDAATQQILRETLDSLEAHKSMQEGLDPLIQMWRKEKGHQASLAPPPGGRGFQQPYPNGYSYAQQGGLAAGQQAPSRHRSTRHGQLPSPVELASRIEEARNTAKILLQLIQSTPSEELLHNDLVREFSDRCQSAQRSMQGYIGADSPPPDDETMLTLIETNEQLSLATTRYQRSLLNARKALGVSPSPNNEAAMQNRNGGAIAAPPPVQTDGQQNLFNGPRSPPRESPGMSAFGNATETYQAPPRPPPQQSSGFTAFSNAAPSSTSPPPPSPPPTLLARLNSREGKPSSPKQSDAAPNASDPFADPVEYSSNAAPLAYNSNNNTSNSSYARNPAHRAHSQTFSVDAGTTYAPGHIHTASVDSDNDAYTSSPVRTSAQPAYPPTSSPTRPYQTAPPTVSYLGRQGSAADHLTMHGAQPASEVSEIDGHSEVGRSGGQQAPSAFARSGTGLTDGDGSAYSVSPVQTRT